MNAYRVSRGVLVAPSFGLVLIQAVETKQPVRKMHHQNLITPNRIKHENHSQYIW